MDIDKHRDSLSREDKFRRSLYELLRDELDQFVLEYALVDSYDNFLEQNIPYPFVELRELKPRARISNIEYKAQNSFLIIFTEDCIESNHKKYIRYFDANKTTKNNLLQHKSFPNIEDFNRTMKFFDSKDFFSLLKSLMPIDYALLIQRSQSTNVNYALTHFHVRIDWPISDAAEDLAKSLRYISKELYEKGDAYAEDLQKKFFEYYGIPVLAGGRRTAAIVAAKYFSSLPGITSIYVSSSESRVLFRFAEKDVSKTILVELQEEDIKKIVETTGITIRSIANNYAIARQKKSYICLFNVQYNHTIHALPPEGGRLRELKPDTSWLTVAQEYILPKPGVMNCAPIPYKMVYS